MKRGWRNWLLPAAGLVLLALVVWGFWPKAQAVDQADVVRGPLRVTVDEDGKTRIKERYIVSTPLAGRLLRIELKAGDEVRVGELLAALEPTDPALLDARQIAASQAAAAAAKKRWEQAAPLADKAQEVMNFAESELGRKQQLFDTASGAITKEELEDAQMSYRVATKEFESARLAEKIAEFEYQQAKAAAEQTTQKPPSLQPPSHGDPKLPDGNPKTLPKPFAIPAPINGRVLRVFQESSTVVQAGDQLLELGDPQDLEVEVDVLSQDAVKIEPRARVSLVHWGGEKPLIGSVRLVEPSAFTKISALGVEEQRVNVIIDFVDPVDHRAALGDGFRVEAEITVWESDDVLKVPTAALFRDQDSWAVFRVADGVAHSTHVEIGHQNALEAEVLKGLSAGDVVVLHPGDTLRDGSRVAPRQMDGKAPRKREDPEDQAKADKRPPGEGR